MSKLGLSFVAFYIALSAVSVNHAFHFNNFKSLAVWLSLPIAFVPQEIYKPVTNLTNFELLSSKEFFLVKLTSQYPIGMAFMAIFLYAWGGLSVMLSKPAGYSAVSLWQHFWVVMQWGVSYLVNGLFRYGHYSLLLLVL